MTPVAQGARGAFKKPDIKPDDIALLQYTGGTTGVSKGAVLLHRNVIANVLQSRPGTSPVMTKVPEGEQPTSICALPLYHIFAFTVNMMLSMRTGGKTILIPNPRDLPAVLKELSKHTFHSFPAVNTLFNGLANHPDFNTVNWKNLKVSVGGGMAVQGAVAKLWLEKTGCPICEGYGLSETSPSASCNPVTANRVHRHHRRALAQHLHEAARRRWPRGHHPRSARRDRHQGPPGDGGLLAAPRRNRQGHDRRRLFQVR
jgi:long-chain acyl-CoA synthetase